MTNDDLFNDMAGRVLSAMIIQGGRDIAQVDAMVQTAVTFAASYVKAKNAIGPIADAVPVPSIDVSTLLPAPVPAPLTAQPVKL